MYPILIEQISHLSVEKRNQAWTNVASNEARAPPSDSALDLLLNLVGPRILYNIPFGTVAKNNPGFMLNHSDIIPVTSDLIQTFVEDGDFDMAETLLTLFPRPSNRRLLRQLMRPTELSDDLALMIHDEYPFLLKYT